jgi:nicotinamide mononucleotide (NMN) deamidase PncC
MTTQSISAPELHALKIVSAKPADNVRKQLKPGTFELDFGVHVTGQLIVGAEGSMSQPTKPSAQMLVAALLSQFGPRKRVQIADQLMEHTLTESIKDSEQTLALAESIINALTTRQLVTRNGNVTGQFNVQPVRIE